MLAVPLLQFKSLSSNKQFVDPLRSVNSSCGTEAATDYADKNRHKEHPDFPVLHLFVANNHVNDREHQINGRSAEEEHTEQSIVTVSVKVESSILQG